MSEVKKVVINILSDKTEENKIETSNTKNIAVDLNPKKTREEIEEEKHQREQEKKSRVPKKRVVTNDTKWAFSEEELHSSRQLEYIMQIIMVHMH